MKMEHVYLSGPIGEAEVSEATRKRFAHAERMVTPMLTGAGYVFNPTDERWQENLRCRYQTDECQIGRVSEVINFYSYALLRDLMELACHDTICLLPGWQSSPGARAELAFARAIGLQVVELTGSDALARWGEEKGGER